MLQQENTWSCSQQGRKESVATSDTGAEATGVYGKGWYLMPRYVDSSWSGVSSKAELNTSTLEGPVANGVAWGIIH